MDLRLTLLKHLTYFALLLQLYTNLATTYLDPASLEWTLVQQIKTPHPTVIDMSTNLMIQTQNYLKDTVGEAGLAFTCTITLTTIPLSNPEQAYITIADYNLFTRAMCRRLLRTNVDMYNPTLHLFTILKILPKRKRL